jgi:hypothetical protein
MQYRDLWVKISSKTFFYGAEYGFINVTGEQHLSKLCVFEVTGRLRLTPSN